MHRSTSGTRRACAVGTTIALVGLTTGLGVFGVQAASADETSPTTTSATSTPTGAPTATATTAAADPSTPSAGTSPSATATTPAATPTDAATTPAATPSASATDAPSTTPTATTTPTPTATATPSPSATPSAPAASVTLSTSTAEVGKTITATATGFGAGTTYTWKNASGTQLQTGTTATFTPSAADYGTTITVTVTDLAGDTASATTAAVTDPATFSEHTSQDDPLELEVTAGQSFTQTFTATGTPAPTYSLGWFYQEDADAAAGDANDTPDSQLPDATALSSSGVLSGTPTYAGTYDFTVVADNGTGKAVEYVELTVDPAAAYGVEVATAGKATFTGGDGTAWIIAPDGSVSTITTTTDAQGHEEGTITDGGRPTVKQGGTLVVEGDLVDQYGNFTSDASGNVPVPTVTSNVASDVITPDETTEGEDSGLVDVTFPHASTHHLTVSADAFSTAFDVDVIPAVTTVVATTSTTTTTSTTGGELAFTGSETTRALPWAIGLLMAGLGVTGLRIARRRTQR